MHKYLVYLFIFTTCVISCTRKKIVVDSNEINLDLNERLNKIVFFNQNIGFIVGGAQFSKPSLLKTIDGGYHWNEVELPVNSEKKEIYNLSIDKSGHIITVGYGGTIFVSSDTGNTFQYIQHSSWKELKDIAFINEQSAIIVGGIGFDKGHISDFLFDGSGSNQIREEKNFELSDIDLVDSNTIYLSGYGAILKSHDQGNHWEFTNAKNDFFKAMSWKNTLEGIAVGYEGSIQKTSDGGKTWSVIRNGNDITLKKFYFLDIDRNQNKSVVAVGENGVVFVSNDDGENWIETSQFSLKDLRGIYFRDETTCFIVGDQGSLFELKL